MVNTVSLVQPWPPRQRPLFPRAFRGAGVKLGAVTSYVSHDRGEESLAAKARWFQSLSLTERMEWLCSVTNLALEVNPRLAERKNARPASDRICVLGATSS